MPDPRITEATPADAAAWVTLRDALWPGAPKEHREEIATLLATPDRDRLTLLAYIDATAIGFAEAAIRRDYVNGCDTTPVAFLEGLYVSPDHRRHGIARALVEAVAAWGRARGCTEFASDADVDNTTSHALHAALGFAETERVVYFRRLLA